VIGYWCLGSRCRRCRCRYRWRFRFRAFQGLQRAHHRPQFLDSDIPSSVLTGSRKLRKQGCALVSMPPHACFLVRFLRLPLWLAGLKCEDNFVARFVVPAIGSERKKLFENDVNRFFFFAAACADDTFYFLDVRIEWNFLVEVAPNHAAINPVLASGKVRGILVVIANMVLEVVQGRASCARAAPNNAATSKTLTAPGISPSTNSLKFARVTMHPPQTAGLGHSAWPPAQIGALGKRLV